MLKNLIAAILKTKPNHIWANIDRTDSLLMVHLTANGKRIAKMQCVIQSQDAILIGDIQHDNEKSDYNKGYGSRMMEALLEYAKEHHFRCVHGNLSQWDLDHKDRLHHFYQKFGFTIIEYPEPQDCYYGKIEIHL